MALHVHKKLGTFLSHPLQNNNVKSLHSVFCEKKGKNGKNLEEKTASTYPDKNNFDKVRHTEYIYSSHSRNS